MHKTLKYGLLTLSTLVMIALGVSLTLANSARAAGASYYLDCSAASNGSGTQASPWNSLATVNGTTFAAGDQLLLKRGSTCTGQLWPKGSGASGSPITLGAYGTGAQPIVNGNSAVDPVVKLYDQQYWVVQDLEIKGSTGKGLEITGSGATTLNYFRVSNVYSHNHGIGDGQSAIVIGTYQLQSVNDVVVDNVTAHDAFRGIDLQGNCCNIPSIRSTNVTVRNSTVHNVQNDGIFVYSTNTVLIENNLAYYTGQQTAAVNHTPNAIWTWDTDNAVVQFNEVYYASSRDKSADGGAFDSDFYSSNTYIQYNYAHDNNNFGVAVYAAENSANVNTVVRYNIFSYNSQKCGMDGDFYMLTWNGGWIDGMQIYNNTSYWNPTTKGLNSYNQPALCNGCIAPWNWYPAYGGSLPRFFKNNIIISAIPDILWTATSDVTLDNNLYWYTGRGSPLFVYGSTYTSWTEYTSFAAYQAASGQDAHSQYIDPLVNSYTYHSIGKPSTQFTLQSGSPAINAGVDVCVGITGCSMGSRDFFGNPIPQGGTYDIGAYESGGAPQNTPTPTSIPPTATRTPTATLVVPTNTNTPGPSPTPTNTPVPPTATFTPTITNTPGGGGGNLALNKPVEVSSTNSGGPGSGAVDGSTSTYWRSLRNSSLPAEWIKVDLQATYTFSQVKLIWVSGKSYATAYTIQGSADGTNWTTVATVTNGDGGTDIIPFSAVSFRYVRLYTTAWQSSGERDWLAEYQIYQ